MYYEASLKLANVCSVYALYTHTLGILQTLLG